MCKRQEAINNLQDTMNDLIGGGIQELESRMANQEDFAWYIAGCSQARATFSIVAYALPVTLGKGCHLDLIARLKASKEGMQKSRMANTHEHFVEGFCQSIDRFVDFVDGMGSAFEDLQERLHGSG